ncbi:MAG: LTA synthase family protein [Oscillospiraceae bacterium]|nr:LTA synthase family protein [Oscillospiraceae bacterium]
MNRFRKNRGITPYRHTGRRTGSPLLCALFFPAVILYHELLLRAFDRDTAFFDLALLRVLLFSAAAGLVVFLLLDLLPWRRAARIAGGVVIGLGAVLLCVERGCRATFGLYYGVSFMGGMAGDVAGDFGSTVVRVILGLIPFILLSFVPLAAYIPLRQRVIGDQGQEMPIRIILAAVLVACQLTAYLLSILGPVKNYYTYEFTANTAIPHFGLLTSARLELEYAVVGVPTAPLDAFLDDPLPTATADPSAAADPSDDPSGAVSEGPSVPIPSGPNVLDIDFETLAEEETNETVQSMHKYFASLTPSEKNEYTGMFEGKNLILLTAEGFSPYAIDPELTPTLYKLTHEGFVFHNFYQPDWTLSTTGGEFAVTTGIIPNWLGGNDASPLVSASRSMPITLAKLFAAEGYAVPAWHNHTYTYYHRDEYLGNFGYDYHGIGNGLELPYNGWPRSDLEMMEATADSYINAYVEDGTPFHAYYMTVSGHGYYSWGGNAMSRKHQEAVEAKYPDLSETSQAYLACNMELDLALEYLVDKLEAAGIADDTLIVMTGDHYPYLMVEDGGADYYNELRGFEDTESDTSRYRNTLLMWSGCIEEPIEVDTPCSSIDIVPTICNLFGLDYDSRLYSGRDIFATNYEPDQYSNCMPLVVFANKGKGNAWITAAGTYECSTKTFTPNEGIELEDEEDYIKRVSRLVAAKVNYSKLIVQEDYYKYVFADSE